MFLMNHLREIFIGLIKGLTINVSVMLWGKNLKGEFEKKFAVLNTCVSIRTKMITFNNNVFITKELMKRPKLRNKFNRNIIHDKLV